MVICLRGFMALVVATLSCVAPSPAPAQSAGSENSEVAAGILPEIAGTAPEVAEETAPEVAEETAPEVAEETAPEVGEGTASLLNTDPADLELTASYSIDFRDRRFDPRRLMPLGHNSLYGLQLLKPEPRGLRIIIPSHQGSTKPQIGVAPAFEIDGDFELTAAYDLVTAETPNRGAAAGANLYIMAVGTGQGVTLRRGVNPEGEHVFFLHWTAPNAQGTLERRGKYMPAESRQGELRLVRRGSTLHYFAADGSGSLEEIHRVEFGTAPIGLVRLEANTDGSATTVDVIWSKFTIRAETLRPVKIPLYEDSTTEEAATACGGESASDDPDAAGESK